MQRKAGNSLCIYDVITANTSVYENKWMYFPSSTRVRAYVSKPFDLALWGEKKNLKKWHWKAEKQIMIISKEKQKCQMRNISHHSGWSLHQQGKEQEKYVLFLIFCVFN